MLSREIPCTNQEWNHNQRRQLMLSCKGMGGWDKISTSETSYQFEIKLKPPQPLPGWAERLAEKNHSAYERKL